MSISVFISYSHDSSEHRDFVRSIADKLRDDGLNCQIDQYINGFPPEGWQRWMEAQVEQADFVLLVCSETYLKRYRGQDSDGGRGVNFEGVVISQTLYDHYYSNTKFIPVIPEGGDLEHVPLPLKGYSTYTLSNDYTALYRVLTDQAATPPNEIGTVKYLPPEKAGGIALKIDLEKETVVAASYTTIPIAAVQAKLHELASELHNEKRTNNNLNELIERYQDEIQEWKEKYEQALEQNDEGLQKSPDNPFLLAEKAALQDGDFELTAQIREQYYRELRKTKRSQQEARLKAMEQLLLEENQDLSREALIAGERWESANNLSKALPLYQEAVVLDEGNRKAWRQITLTAKKLGQNQLALEATRVLQRQLDPETDLSWLSVAMNDEGALHSLLGNNTAATNCFHQSMQITLKLVEAEPENTDWQRDLSVSYDNLGDMHKANGDGESALKAYEESLAIRKTLAELDPRHLDWKNDLSISLEKIGDMQVSEGDIESAIETYSEKLNLDKYLVSSNPEIVKWQTDLVVSYYKLSTIQVEKTQELLDEALAILKRLNAESRLDYERQGWIPILEDALKQ